MRFGRCLVALSCLLSLLASCGGSEHSVEGAGSTPSPMAQTAYLAFETRTHGGTNSLNQDATDREDYVSKLRLLAYDKNTHEIVYNVLMTDLAGKTNYSKKMPVKVGSYDFYFVGNETPAMTPALEAARFVDALYQMPALAQAPYDFEQANLPVATRQPFVMTAIVPNQMVGEEHTENNPLPVEVVLTRVLAKATITIGFENPSNTEWAKGLKIDDALLEHVPETYSLFPPRKAYTGSLKSVNPSMFRNLTYETLRASLGQRIVKTVYLPERLVPSGVAAESSMSFAFQYSKHGIHKDIKKTIDHLVALSTPVALSRYSTVRNHDYALDVKLKGWDEEPITFDWKVLPWRYVKSAKNFADIAVENENSNPALGNPGIEVDPQKSNLLRMHAGATNKIALKFKIYNPVGAVWRFSIDNALDFKLEVRHQHTQELYTNATGVVVAGDNADGVTPSEVEVIVTALKPYNGSVRSTELYLTVNGIEVQIVPAFKAAGIDSEPTKRYLLIQSL